ncbi:MAG: hypothetical protein ACLT4X_02675 [Phascolarctobacterium sp.]
MERLRVLGSYMTEAFNVKGILKTVSEALGEFQDKMRSAQEAGKSFGNNSRECPCPVDCGYRSIGWSPWRSVRG